MTKFSEIIDIDKPVLIDFYYKGTGANINILKNVTAALGKTTKVIKIDIEKNENLVDALQIKGNPTFMIYKNGKMKWRQTGEQDASTLINLVQQYL